MKVAVTGIRDIDEPTSAASIEQAMVRTLEEGASEIRFGGARGCDTLALVAAGRYLTATGGTCRLVAIVPFLFVDQPLAARAAIDEYADVVVEMQRPRGMISAYFERNLLLLEGVDRLVAFTDGALTGGTAHTIARAQARGIVVYKVTVRRGWKGVA